jgi:hypothetical protein
VKDLADEEYIALLECYTNTNPVSGNVLEVSDVVGTLPNGISLVW